MSHKGEEPRERSGEEPRTADGDHTDRQSQERYAAAQRRQVTGDSRDQVHGVVDRSGSSNDPTGN